MRDIAIIAGASLCAILGVVGLYITAREMQPVRLEISSIQGPGSFVACEGIVFKITYRGEHCFVKIYDGTTIDVPFFNYTGEISIGDLLYVEGKVFLYNGQLEIIPVEYQITKVVYGLCRDSKLYTQEGVFCTELDEGFHAVIGVLEGNHFIVERDIPSSIFASFQGRVSSFKEDTFQIFGSPFRFFSVNEVRLGEVFGFGVQIGEDIAVLYFQWNELPLETIAEAKQYPEGYPVRISGIIESVRISKGHIFLVVHDSTGCVLVPIFKDMQVVLGVNEETFQPGQKITVVGWTKDYQGAFEILPEDIT